MITLYNPETKANFASDGASGVSPQLLQLNILIELRVMNEILLGNAGTNSAESLRSDAVNETNLPVI